MSNEEQRGEKHRCCAKLSESGRFGWMHPRNCRLAAKIERDGEWYCGTHDPVRVAERDQRRRDRWHLQWKREKDELNAKIQREARIGALVALAAGDTSSREELRELAKQILGKP